MLAETTFDASKQNSNSVLEEDWKQKNSQKQNVSKKHLYLTIKPDQGGKEARDFCSIMERMLLKYCNDKNINADIINDSEYEIVLRIQDDYENWEWLSGFHKIVRVSPFGKADKIQTSLCRITVSNPSKKLNLSIDEKDIRMDCFKSTGPGGQHRNKTMSAVRLTHLPTKIVTVSAAERSQFSNKEYAMEQLIEKLKDYEDNLQRMKNIEKRRDIFSQKDVVLTFYYNHKMVVNEKAGIKNTNIKNILNGDLDLVKN